jgi:hypothetical protein
MSDEQDRMAVVGRREMERRGMEEARARCIARFVERQRRKRRWIPLLEIANQHGMSAGPAGCAGYDQTYAWALRALSQAVCDGEFERAGKCRVLYLPPDMSLSDRPPYFAAPLRWLEPEAYRIARNATAPELPLDVLGCCWLSRELTWQWLTAHGSRWPAHFGPPPAPHGKQATGQPERALYEARVEEIRKSSGRAPPLQTTKSGALGDREWAVANGISRPKVEKWRRELLGRQSRGRPKNSAGNSQENNSSAELTN